MHAASLAFAFSMCQKLERYPSYDLLHLYVHARSFNLNTYINLTNFSCPDSHAILSHAEEMRASSHAIQEKKKDTYEWVYMHQQICVTLLLSRVAPGLGCSSIHNKSLCKNRSVHRTLRSTNWWHEFKIKRIRVVGCISANWVGTNSEALCEKFPWSQKWKAFFCPPSPAFWINIAQTNILP